MPLKLRAGKRVVSCQADRPVLEGKFFDLKIYKQRVRPFTEN